MSSARGPLRTRLILWYVLIAAFVTLLVSVAGAEVTYQLVARNARQSLHNAARDIPALVGLYESRTGSLARAEPLLIRHFAGSGIMVFVRRSPEGTSPRPRPRHDIFGFMARGITPEAVKVNGGTVLLGPDPARFRSAARSLGISLLIFALLALGASWYGATLVARQALDPLLKTTAALERFGHGDFTPQPVATNDRGELGALARAYNRAVKQITEAFEERARVNAQMQQFVGDAGHQLRTPLTVIMGYLSGMCAKDGSAPRETAIYRSMLAESRRMKLIIDDLITLARLERPADGAGQTQEVPADLRDVAERVVESFRASGQGKIAIASHSDGPIFVSARENDLAGALASVLDNARKYAPESAVDVRLRRLDGHAVLTVADEGPGMSQGDLERAFDRFHRGSSGEGTEGTGLGLSIVRRIVERAGGEITLRNTVPHGLCCTMTFPEAGGHG